MKLSKFTFKAIHDKGSLNITTVATNKETARNIIASSEGCPLSSLIYIKTQGL